MRALRLEKPGMPLELVDAPEPVLRPGGAVVRIEAAHVPSFMGAVLSGALPFYDMPVPFIPGPGAIGVVEQVADDVPWLQAGRRVFLDIDLKSRTPGAPHDHILIGMTAMAPEGHALQRLWRDGTFAERVCYPAECLTPVGEAGDRHAPETLAALNFLCIAYGGLLGGQLRPGQAVAINGATGVLGSCAVLVALAMGATRIVAVGREPDLLARVASWSPRIRAVAVAGDEGDSGRIREAAGGFGPDLVLDALGNVPVSGPVLAGLRALRQGGTAVLCGGVPAALDIPYLEVMARELTIRGVFMFPRSAPGELLAMVAAGSLDLTPIQVETYPLERAGQALQRAATSKGLALTMLAP